MPAKAVIIVTIVTYLHPIIVFCIVQFNRSLARVTINYSTYLLTYLLDIFHCISFSLLTTSTPAVPNYCCSKGPTPNTGLTRQYWPNPPFLISDIRALWRSGLSVRAPKCQKLTSSSAMAERPRELDHERFQMGGGSI